MIKKIIVHIGANKTGSSAIQRFLGDNAQILRQKGFVVPDVTLGIDGEIEGHQVWVLDEMSADISGGQRKIAQLITEVNQRVPHAHTLLISAENLSNHCNLYLLFEEVVKNYPTQVILYIRRQDDYLLSSWQQWYCKIEEDFWPWLLSELGALGNWRTCLEQWETILDSSHINVRVFERDKLFKQDVVKDFLHLIGLDAEAADFSFTEDAINPSFCEAVTQLAHENRELFGGNVHNNDFFDALLDLTGNQFIKKGKESLLDHQQRQRIMRFYADDNDWVRKKYFPDALGLFRPIADERYILKSSAQLEAEKKRVLIAMILGLYKKLCEKT